METLILIAGIVLLFWFKQSIKGSAQMLETLVNETNNTLEDSITTYGNEVLLANADKRSDQLERIQQLDTIVTSAEIRDILNAKRTQQNQGDGS